MTKKKSFNYKKFQLRFLVLLILFTTLISFIHFNDNSNNSDSNQQSKNHENILNYVEKKEKLKTSNPGPQLSYYSFQVDDDDAGNSQGDNDGKIDAGETIELGLTLQNVGDQNALDVSATLTSSNLNVNIINGFQEFGTIPHSSTGISSSFYVLKIKSSCSSDYYITLDIEIQASNGGPWNDNFQIHVIGCGNPSYNVYSVYSESDGDFVADDDEIVDPGEIINFNIYIKNRGGANLYGITGIIEEADIYTTINDNSGDFGDINSNGDIESGRFGITVSGTCPTKHQIDFNLILTDDESTVWELSFYIIVSGISDYIITDYAVIEQYDSTGDDDDDVDAGEIWYLSITIKNIGVANGMNVKVFIDSDDDYITFDEKNEDSRFLRYTYIYMSRIGTFSAESTYGFRVSSTETPNDHEVDFDIKIMDDSGCLKTFEISITIVKGAEPEFEIDWLMTGMVALIILIMIGICGFLYTSHHWKLWNKINNKFKTIFTSREKEKQFLEKIFENREITDKELREIEKIKFESLIKKSNSVLNMSRKLFLKKSYEVAVDNWKEAIDCYSQALEKAPSPDENNLKFLREDICNLYLKFMSINCLLTKGFSIIFQDNKIISKPTLGLNVFIANWLESRGDDSNE